MVFALLYAYSYAMHLPAVIYTFVPMCIVTSTMMHLLYLVSG